MRRSGSVAKDVPPERTAGTIGDVPPVNGGMGIAPSTPVRNADRRAVPGAGGRIAARAGRPGCVAKRCGRLQDLTKADAEGCRQEYRDRVHAIVDDAEASSQYRALTGETT